MKEEVIFSIDPGFGRIGFAIIKKSVGKNPDVIFSECFETDKTKSFIERVASIVERMEGIIAKHSPSVAALEQLFFAKNKITASQVSEVRGVLMYILHKNNIPFFEYTPKQVKVSITGDGGADKEQVKKMLPLVSTFNKTKKVLDDECDAVAVGITHAVQRY